MIDIFMATYNGEKFIREQITSIMNQTYTEWILYIHDDGSTDNTLEEIKKIKDPRIQLIEDGKTYKNSTRNFLALVRGYSKSDYFCFADQDDYWLPEKLEYSLNFIKKVEGNNYNIPICIGTDLKVVDQELNIINESFYDYSKIKHDNSFSTLLLENSFTGCTMFMNKKVADYIKRIDIDNDYIIQHDWFIALICASDGLISQSDVQTILYRQHVNNVVGAKEFSLKRYFAHPSDIIYMIKRIKKLHTSVESQLATLSIYINNSICKEFVRCYLSTKGIAHKKFIIQKKIYDSNNFIKQIVKIVFY